MLRSLCWSVLCNVRGCFAPSFSVFLIWKFRKLICHPLQTVDKLSFYGLFVPNNRIISCPLVITLFFVIHSRIFPVRIYSSSCLFHFISSYVWMNPMGNTSEQPETNWIELLMFEKVMGPTYKQPMISSFEKGRMDIHFFQDRYLLIRILFEMMHLIL